MRFNGSGTNGEVRLIPSISVQGPDDNGTGLLSENGGWSVDGTERHLNEIFSGLYRKRSSSLRSESSMDVSSTEGVSPRFGEVKPFVPAPTSYGMTGSRVMTLEEELQERLKYVNEVASLWQRRCRQERDENMRIRDQIVTCEKQCKDLVDNVRDHYEQTIGDLNSDLKKYRTQYDKLLHIKSSQDKDHAAQIKLLEFQKSKLEKHTDELETNLGEMAQRALVYKKEIQYLKDDLKAKNQRLSDIKSLAHSIELMEKKTTELEGRVKELNTELDQKAQINQTLRTQNAVYKSENDRIVEEMVSERTQAEHECKSLKDVMNVLKERQEELQNRNRELEVENRAAKEDYEELFRKYQKLHVKQMDTSDNGDNGECNHYNVLLDIALTKVAQLEEMHFGCPNHASRKVSNSAFGDFQICVDEDNPTLIQITRMTEQESGSRVSGDQASMASDGVSAGSDISGCLDDSFGSDARSLPVTSAKDTSIDSESEFRSGSSSEMRTSRSMTMGGVVKTASCSDLRPTSRSVCDTARRLTPPPTLSNPWVAGQARNSLQVTQDRVNLARMTSVEKQQRNMALPVLAASKFLKQKYKITPPSHHPVSVHITTASPQSSAQSSPANSPQHREVVLRPRPMSAPARTLSKSRSLSESETETILEEPEDDTLLVRSLTIDNDFLKPERPRLRKRSASEKNLNTKGFLDLVSTSATSETSPSSSSDQTCTTDQAQSSMISGFEGLRNRRNGIIDMPLPVNKNIKVAKKSKAGDFFRKLSKEAKENNAFEIKSSRKRSWKLKPSK